MSNLMIDDWSIPIDDRLMIDICITIKIVLIPHSLALAGTFSLVYHSRLKVHSQTDAELEGVMARCSLETMESHGDKAALSVQQMNGSSVLGGTSLPMGWTSFPVKISSHTDID